MTNIEIIKQVYSGLNQNDLDLALSRFDAHVVREEFEDSPMASSVRGQHEIRQHFKNGRSSWAEGSCEPVEFISNENKTVVIAHVKVRVKNESEWRDAYVADGFAIKDGLITEFHSFTSKEKAFKWAGIAAHSDI